VFRTNNNLKEGGFLMEAFLSSIIRIVALTGIIFLAYHWWRYRRFKKLFDELHAHTCDWCGNTWTHGSECFDDIRAHTCKVCGMVQPEGYIPSDHPGLNTKGECHDDTI